jgi:hypothetical protein
VGDEKQRQARGEAGDEQRRGELLIGKVGQRGDMRDGPVVGPTKVLHAVLQVAHVAEEVLAKFRGRADLCWRCEGRAGERIEIFERNKRWRGVSCEKGGEHDEVESYGERDDAERVWV